MKIDRNNAYDVYIPDSLKDDDTAVIYCHGGAFRYGDKGDDEKFLSVLAQKSSMKVYSAGYRNLDDARCFVNMINDIKACIDTVAEQDEISHFILMGASSGAYLVWILSLMFCDNEKYSIDAVVLVSGYLLFEEEDGITNALCMFPAFQYFPTELKNVDMDYSGYKLPERVLLVTGDGDGCKKDSEVLYAALKKTASAKPEIVCAASDSEETDHCFIINDPYSEVAQRVFARIIECVNPMAE